MSSKTKTSATEEQPPIDPENLQTASKYLNNLLLSRGLLRDGHPIEFAKPKESTMVTIINLVHDLVLRRDVRILRTVSDELYSNPRILALMLTTVTTARERPFDYAIGEHAEPADYHGPATTAHYPGGDQKRRP